MVMADMFQIETTATVILPGRCRKCENHQLAPPWLLPKGHQQLWKRPDLNMINAYLPMELLREIFLYSIESNQTKSGQLASVCRYWRSVITTIPGIWSTLRVGAWTVKERVTTWLQRAYPKKVIIEVQSDIQSPSNTTPFAALLSALTCTDQWHELTISSFPPEYLASQLGFQTACRMNVLRGLHVAAGCVDSLSFTHLLDLIPTEAPLSELRLYPSFATTHFLQSNWFPVLKNLRVLIVNGRGIQEPFSLLPAFTQLQIFEADHLPLPWYEPNINLPLLCTLQKLQIRASSVQWMAGREFRCLEECVILFPRHWMTVQQHGVQLPSCRKLTYHCYPMTTVQYLHAPQMKLLGLGSNDCKERRVYEHLHYLCTLDETIFKLTTLHLTLQCSEQAFVKVLKYFEHLQELVLSTAHPSSSWKCFLNSLAAKGSTNDQPKWDNWDTSDTWFSSQTWHVNVLPHLKYLGIKCPKGFSPSECLGNYPLFRLIAWTRAQSSSPLEHLKVWEGRGTTEDIVTDYVSSGYLQKYLGVAGKDYDSMVVTGMISQHLEFGHSGNPLFFQLHMTALFGQLQSLTILKPPSPIEIPILPHLEQIKRLSISLGTIPAYPLNIRLPLVHTLQWLYLGFSTTSWMIGRTFEALEECNVYYPKMECEYKGLQADLPVCTKLAWVSSPDIFYGVFCPNGLTVLQNVSENDIPSFEVSANLFSYSSLQTLRIGIRHYSGVDSLIQHIFCDSSEQGVWKNIRRVNMGVYYYLNGGRGLFNEMVGRQQHYAAKGWRKFMVYHTSDYSIIELEALM